MIPDPEVARQIEAFYIAHNLHSSAHRTVLNYLLTEPPRPTVEGAERSRSWAKLTYKTAQPLSNYAAAIADLSERDLVWNIDAIKLGLISGYLKSDPALGPTEGMPEIGTLQISIRFADLLIRHWASIDCQLPGVLWSRDWQSEKRQLIYSPTRKGCFDFLRDELVDDEHQVEIEHLSGPNPGGPWRCRWWRKYETGYVLELRYV
ncbi:MAG: hypothetical protein KF851_16535 [Pirellulaceae bacterium]|nr:hypothetical protein [Pirellulaceae bacterium]